MGRAIRDVFDLAPRASPLPDSPLHGGGAPDSQKRPTHAGRLVSEAPASLSAQGSLGSTFLQLPGIPLQFPSSVQKLSHISTHMEITPSPSGSVVSS